MDVGSDLQATAIQVSGRVNLRRAQIDMLYTTPDVWPDVVSLDELTYATLVPRLPAEQGLPLLEREGLGYVPYSYEQLTAAYRRIGDAPTQHRQLPTPVSFPVSQTAGPSRLWV